MLCGLGIDFCLMDFNPRVLTTTLINDAFSPQGCPDGEASEKDAVRHMPTAIVSELIRIPAQ